MHLVCTLVFLICTPQYWNTGHVWLCMNQDEHMKDEVRQISHMMICHAVFSALLLAVCKLYKRVCSPSFTHSYMQKLINCLDSL